MAWLFRVPDGTTVTKGEVVEPRLAQAEGSMGVGKLSQMTRKLGLRNDFANDGHAAIFCKCAPLRMHECTSSL